MQNHVGIAALAGPGLGAVAEPCRSDEPPGRCSLGVDSTTRRSDRHVVCPERVITDVLRQEIDEAIRIAVNAYCFLQILERHPDQLDIARVLLVTSQCKYPVATGEVERNTALNPDVAIKAPAADNLVDQT